MKLTKDETKQLVQYAFWAQQRMSMEGCSKKQAETHTKIIKYLQQEINSFQETVDKEKTK